MKLFLPEFGNNLGPSDVELLKLLDQCDLTSSRCTTPRRFDSESSLSQQLQSSSFLRFHHQHSSSSLGTSYSEHHRTNDHEQQQPSNNNSRAANLRT